MEYLRILTYINEMPQKIYYNKLNIGNCSIFEISAIFCKIRNVHPAAERERKIAIKKYFKFVRQIEGAAYEH